MDDYYLNLLDWGSGNVLSIALGNTVYLWNATDGSTSELTTVEEDYGPVTSVSWAPDGRHIAIGLNSSDVQLWDSSSNRLVSHYFGFLIFSNHACLVRIYDFASLLVHCIAYLLFISMLQIFCYIYILPI